MSRLKYSNADTAFLIELSKEYMSIILCIVDSSVVYKLRMS